MLGRAETRLPHWTRAGMPAVSRGAVDVFSPWRSRLGESPLWDIHRGPLMWVDCDSATILRASRAGGISTFPVDIAPTAVVLASRGYGVVTRTSVGMWQPPEASLRSELAILAPDSGVCMNDAAVDRSGRLWIGSRRRDGRDGEPALHRIDRDGAVTIAHAGGELLNGIDWSPSGQVLYLVDSASRVIHRFAFSEEEGTVGRRLDPIRLPATGGMPDGIAVDESGAVWVAVWGGGCVRRYTPTGAIDMSIPVPVRNVSSVAFGEAGYRTLFITTAHGDDGDDDPELAGAVFATRVDSGGLAPRVWQTLQHGDDTPISSSSARRRGGWCC